MHLLFKVTTIELEGVRKMKLQEKQVAMAVGVFIGGWHVVWSLLVAAGLAQGWLDFIFGIHMINNPLVVAPFNISTTVLLIVVTFAVGYIVGWVFARLWNYLHKG